MKKFSICTIYLIDFQYQHHPPQQEHRYEGIHNTPGSHPINSGSLMNDRNHVQELPESLGYSQERIPTQTNRYANRIPSGHPQMQPKQTSPKRTQRLGHQHQAPGFCF